MDNNYKAYVQKYYSTDNPETKALLKQIKEALKNCEACIKILNIFNSELEGTYTERLARLHNFVIQEKNKNKTNQKKSKEYFTWPEDILFDGLGRFSDTKPVFLGVCFGKYDIKRVLDKSEEHCEMIMAFPDRKDKIILIFTDKWNDFFFQKEYAATFIRYANKHNILFLFLLVTDLGVSQIPFLTLNRNTLYKRRDWKIGWSASHIRKSKEIKKWVYDRKTMRFLYHFSYRVHYFGYTKSSTVCWLYEFDFYRQKCFIYKTTAKSARKESFVVNIPITAMNKFAQDVMFYRDLYEEYLCDIQYATEDKILHTARFPGKEFKWGENPIIFSDLESAFTVLLKSLDEQNPERWMPKQKES